MTEQEKMLSGQLYFAGGPELLAARKKAKELCQRFNQTAVQDPETGAGLLRELLGRMGEHQFRSAHLRALVDLARSPRPSGRVPRISLTPLA